MTDLAPIDNIIDEAFKSWSGLINDPAIPSSQRANSLGVTGVSISFAGDWLPRGRVTRTNASKEILQYSLKPLGLELPTSDWSRYWRDHGDLFLYLYWKLYGRNVALAYHVLHGAHKERLIYVDLTGGEAPPHVSHDKLTNVTKVSLGALGKLLELTIAEGKCFLKMVFETSFKDNPASPEELQEVASDIASQMREPGGCLDSYLNDRSLEVRARLSDIGSQPFTNAFLELFDLNEACPASRRKSVETAVQMLQLLYLYQLQAGNHAYLICPEGSADEVRVCFLFWATRPLGDLSAPFETARRLVTEMKASLNKATQHWSNNSATPTTVLNNVIGSSLEPTLAEKMSERQRPWLGHYLVLCERMADLAVHEGKNLGFSFFVSSGEAASKEIEFLSSLSSNGTPHRWEVDANLKPIAGSEEIISRLLGNYSFLQGTGCVIQASWWGHLLALGKLLDGRKTPETLTKGLDDAYLIRIETNRDIKVFFTGNLVLWRRGARWLVPTWYGDQYIGQLEVTIKAMLPSANASVLHELCTNAWELSNHGRGGGCFVLADLSSGTIEDGMMKMTQVFPFAEGRKLLTPVSRQIFQDLAIQDGAALVDVTSGEVRGRRQIAVPMTPTEWEEHLTSLRTGRWKEDSHKLLRWGTRHLNALRAALHYNGEAVVITVSSDGDIHLFDKYGPVIGATYPGI